MPESAPNNPNLYLIGLSGTGKTRSGRRSAELLELPFVEMDGVIEDRAGKSIPEIFSDSGEPFFRDLESEILEEVAERGGRVVSTGGGVPLRESNRAVMKQSGLIIQLSASPETIHERLTGSAYARGRALRPLLGDDAPIEKLRLMMQDRAEAYSVAHAVIDTENKSHDEVASEIEIIWTGYLSND